MSATTKTCPFCAESIPARATVCPLCQSQIGAAAAPSVEPAVIPNLAGYWVTGLVTLIAGGVVMGLGLTDEGVPALVTAGIVLSVVGSIVLQIAVIASGVLIALRVRAGD